MCSCGNKEDHIIARRKTADGIIVFGWSDGDITFGMGRYPQGIGKTRDARVRDRVLDQVTLFDAGEVAGLIRQVRAEVRRGA